MSPQRIAFYVLAAVPPILFLYCSVARLNITSIVFYLIACILKKGLPEGPRNQTDWADYFRSNGMAFPKGGFAAYHPEAEVLIIANTEDQLRLLEYL